MRYLTAGESHGYALNAIIEGMPAGVTVDLDRVNNELRRRQSGYGRGGRMKIETDTVNILSGLRGGITTGAPISLLIYNNDYANWAEAMDPVDGKRDLRPVYKVRPGHADLAGVIKYKLPDARYVLERASARETAIRTAVGAVARELLYPLNIIIGSHVTAIGGLRSKLKVTRAEEAQLAESSDVRCLDPNLAGLMKQAIDIAAKSGDTLGGEAEIIACGVRAGIGSHVHYDRKLDYKIMGALGSIQGIKAVAIGEGFKMADLVGSQTHDEMYINDGKIFRRTNNAGGVEGGISNGENIVAHAIMKAIPTLMRGLNTVDISDNTETTAETERSDICAVPAMSVICENVLAFTLAEAIMETVGGDYLEEVITRYMIK